MFRTDVEFVMIMNLVYFSAVLTGCFDNHQKAEMLKYIGEGDFIMIYNSQRMDLRAYKDASIIDESRVMNR